MQLESFTFVLLRRPVDAPDLPEERAIMADDPAVVAGRLVADIMTWWTLRGSLRTSASS
jgi:hypothetical protein